MTHCRDTNFQATFSGSSPAMWTVKKDGIPISAVIETVNTKIRVRIEASALVVGNSFTIYDNTGASVGTYTLVDC